jgi:putative component of membrane protein insertase Oxa1/YidC/SpoIIIJ protein YidD
MVIQKKFRNPGLSAGSRGTKLRGFITGVFAFVLFCQLPAIGQGEHQRWEKRQNLYQSANSFTDSQIIRQDEESKSLGLLKAALTLYKTFVSNVDGDRCPFYPSCSSFFIHAVRKTDFLEGTLLFADRFTRDANIYDRYGRYPFSRELIRFIDPVDRYLHHHIQGCTYPDAGK